jgi:hypothetical protein
MREEINELLLRECHEAGGTKVINCVRHMGMSLTSRPTNCELCATDVKNRFADAIAVNEWLNTWKDDAEALLRRAIQEAA